MQKLTKDVFVTTSAGTHKYKIKYLRSCCSMFWNGMVSLGQYVVNCWFTTGSHVWKFKRGRRHSIDGNCIHQEKRTREKVLNVQELCQGDNSLCCKKKYCGYYCNAKHNKSNITSLPERKGIKTLNAAECFCRNSHVQFSPPKNVNKALRTSTFDHNEDHFLCECGFCDRCLQKSCKTEQYNIGCGIVPFFNKLFSANQSSTKQNVPNKCARHSMAGGGIFDFLDNSFSTSNNATSVEANCQHIFHISKEPAKTRIFHMAEKKNNSNYSISSYRVGCENIPVEMELLSSKDGKGLSNTKDIDVRTRDKSKKCDKVPYGIPSFRDFLCATSTSTDANKISSSAICSLPVSFNMHF